MVSVIIPMYNASKTIVSCIESVFNQTYKGMIEIIVVNDGSTDDSVAKIENMNNVRSTNITLCVLNKPNGGVSSARNLGLANAEGDYIAFLDSDDEWIPCKLDKQVKILEDNDSIGLVGGLINQATFYKNGLMDVSLNMLIFKNYFQPSTVVMKKNIIKSIGYFDETQKYAEEGNYFIRIANSYRCVLLKEYVVNYGQGKRGYGVSGLSANICEMEKGELRNLKFALRHNYIKRHTYFLAVSYSLVKFLRRILVSRF